MKRTPIATFTLPLLAALLAVSAVAPARAQRADRDRREEPVITVQGTGDSRVEPDIATVRLGITSQATTAGAVQAEVSRTAQAILEAVVRTGLDRKQIQTSQLILHPIYAPQKPENLEPPRIVAYRASNVVSIRIEQISKSGQVIDAGLKAGANELQGISFGLKDELPARERALREAVKEAQSKARVIAEALGVKLGPVQEVQEGGVHIVQPFMGGAMMARAADASTPVSPGEITVNANVTVRYRIGG
ncbi:MAG: outer membrane protein 28Kda [Armatimonadetes bacterium]|jgi:uncharacterized protein YggE|nr:outer membrane protein 28Kda [Armatimonadota bacterium]